MIHFFLLVLTSEICQVNLYDAHAWCCYFCHCLVACWLYMYVFMFLDTWLELFQVYNFCFASLFYFDVIFAILIIVLMLRFSQQLPALVDIGISHSKYLRCFSLTLSLRLSLVSFNNVLKCLNYIINFHGLTLQKT